MKVTNSRSSISIPSEALPLQKDAKPKEIKDSLSQKSSTKSSSKFCEAIKAICNNFLRCLTCIFCWKIFKKESNKDLASLSSTDQTDPTIKGRTPKEPKNQTLEEQSSTRSSDSKKKEKVAQPVAVPTTQKTTPKTIVANFDKEIRELQELVNTAPIHPWTATLGQDLASKGIYEKAQHILVSIKNPQARYEAYIKFADSIVNPALKKLGTKYPTTKGAKQAAQDATATFTYLLSVRQNCLTFSSEEMRQVKGSYSTVVPEGYLPTRLNIQLLAMIQEWNKLKDPYFDELGSSMTSFLTSSAVSKWNQRSGFFKVFQDNFVDFRS